MRKRPLRGCANGPCADAQTVPARSGNGHCGGLCARGTCLFHVPAQWSDRCGVPDELEEGILEFSHEVDETSRLSCQIEITASLDGLVVTLPSRQY